LFVQNNTNTLLKLEAADAVKQMVTAEEAAVEPDGAAADATSAEADDELRKLEAELLKTSPKPAPAKKTK